MTQLGRGTHPADTGDLPTPALVYLARAGDQLAWEAIVNRYERLVWTTARRGCHDDTQAADVVQNTWMRLVEHIGRIRSPEHLAAWLTVTARREAWRVATDARRAVPVESVFAPDGSGAGHSPVEDAVVETDDHEWLRRAAGSLPAEWQPLFGLLMSGEARTYREISSRLGIPVGSIGPTRARCIRQLRLFARSA